MSRDLNKRANFGELCLHKKPIGSCDVCKSGDIETSRIGVEAEKVLHDMGLEWGDLEGKSILEIGAGLAELAQVAKKKGIDVVSLEINPDMWKEEGTVPDNVEYIVGDANKLPFEDGSLDLIISKAAPPTISKSLEEVVSVLGEAMRVLKVGGIIRFGPARLHPDALTSDFLGTREPSGLSLEQKKQMVIDKSFDLLRSLYPNAMRLKVDDEQSVYEIEKE